MASSQRIAELKAAFGKEAPWGSRSSFFDSLESVRELEELTPLIEETIQSDGGDPVKPETFARYRADLLRWPDPKLEDGFREKFPRLSAKLDTQQKIRMFLRGVSARQEKYTSMSTSDMAAVFEDLLEKREGKGCNTVVFPNYEGSPRCDALGAVIRPELPFKAMTDMLLPGIIARGMGPNDSCLYIDWRPEAKASTARYANIRPSERR